MPDPFFARLAGAARAGALIVSSARGGFACNSSSSHSIVIMPRAGFLPHDEGDDRGDGYGWEDFALTEPAAKIAYLATMLGETGPVADRAAELGGTPRDYVDNQSHIDWPLDYHTREVSDAFIAEFAAMLEDPRVAILGGNDNDGDSQYHRAENLILPTRNYRGWTARKDTVVDGDGDEHSWWVLFDGSNGTKLRIGLDPEWMYATSRRRVEDPEWSPRETVSTGLQPDKAATPELVDVKISDYCAYRCGFCYTNSTRDGAHADPEFVARIIAALAKLQVFEVAFGGGEPTLWPGFKQAVIQCREVGIVPNATTRNWSWAGRNPTACGELGALAWSVSSADDLRRVGELGAPALKPSATSWRGRTQLSLQAIPAIMTAEEFGLLFETAEKIGRWQVGITLLGYKPVGRGYSFRSDTIPADRGPDWWIPAWKKRAADWPAVAIDTVLAGECEKALAAEGVPEWSYHTHEGRFSMFVDAVAGLMGPSSYEPEKLIQLDITLGVDDLAEAILAGFRKW
jgi:hypothetical protein